MPFVLSYDGIIKRAKMNGKQLDAFLSKLNMGIESMKKPLLKICIKNI